VRYYSGTGTQKAVVDSLAPFTEYFQIAPSHMHNVALVYTKVISPSMVNNPAAGHELLPANINDLDTSPNPGAAGPHTGVTAATLAGSPTLRISRVRDPGATQPLGRIDTTGHVTDTLNWTKRPSPDQDRRRYRKALMDIFYEANTRGTFTFDATRGPWAATGSTYTSQQKGTAGFSSRAIPPTRAAQRSFVRRRASP